MATLTERIETLESQIAQLQTDQVTRRQFSSISVDFDTSVSTINDSISGLTNRVNAIAAAIASLGASQSEVDTYVHEQTSGSTTWTVTHNLGYKYLHVLVVNDSDVVIEPSTITYTGDNTLTLTFAASQTGKAVVSRVG